MVIPDVHNISVHGPGLFGCHGNWNAVLLRIPHQVLAAEETLEELLLPPGRDHFGLGPQCVHAQLETDLVVAFAGGTVRNVPGNITSLIIIHLINYYVS